MTANGSSLEFNSVFHNVFISLSFFFGVMSPEELFRAGRVHTIHVIKVGHLGNIADINDGPFLHQRRDFGEHLIHDVYLWVFVRVAKADDHEAVIFAEDGLVDVP